MTANPSSPVAPTASTTFDVTVTPGVGAFSFDIAINNDDVDENPYDIAVSGSHGMAVGEEGTVIYSNDGGREWKTEKVPIQARLFWFDTVSFRANSKPVGFGAGAHGFVFRIRDGQLIW